MDNYYRHQELRGHVHDMGSAMLDGVAGHAGLFSNANDLGKLMHMYLFKGQYGERQFVSKEAIEEFTRCQFCDVNNRRGIGFDKPTIDGSGGPTCNCVSLLSFGHSGFTGTLAWVDPQEDIVYIFLSNRTYPTAENRKLITMGTRTKLMQVIYDNLNTYQPTKKKL
jgi:CubicO group peptidase (beta-lactamase class C family)